MLGYTGTGWVENVYYKQVNGCVKTNSKNFKIKTLDRVLKIAQRKLIASPFPLTLHPLLLQILQAIVL